VKNSLIFFNTEGVEMKKYHFCCVILLVIFGCRNFQSPDFFPGAWISSESEYNKKNNTYDLLQLNTDKTYLIGIRNSDGSRVKEADGSDVKDLSGIYHVRKVTVLSGNEITRDYEFVFYPDDSDDVLIYSLKMIDSEETGIKLTSKHTVQLLLKTEAAESYCFYKEEAAK
jgi:hypothetical protein